MLQRQNAFSEHEDLLTENLLKDAFNYFDIDNSGEISLDELKNIISLTGSTEEESEFLKKILNEVDENKDSSISFEEFKNLFIKLNNKLK